MSACFVVRLDGDGDWEDTLSRDGARQRKLA
jgi:hypothetical protein